jgi:hypothetical protein
LFLVVIWQDFDDIVYKNSHDVWLVLVLAAPEKCGQGCEMAESTFQKVRKQELLLLPVFKQRRRWT